MGSQRSSSKVLGCIAGNGSFSPDSTTALRENPPVKVSPEEDVPVEMKAIRPQMSKRPPLPSFKLEEVDEDAIEERSSEDHAELMIYQKKRDDNKRSYQTRQLPADPIRSGNQQITRTRTVTRKMNKPAIRRGLHGYKGYRRRSGSSKNSSESHKDLPKGSAPAENGSELGEVDEESRPADHDASEIGSRKKAPVRPDVEQSKDSVSITETSIKHYEKRHLYGLPGSKARRRDNTTAIHLSSGNAAQKQMSHETKPEQVSWVSCVGGQ